MDAKDRDEIAEAVTLILNTMIGPTGDLVRAMMAAQVDGLIDAYQRFQGAGMPDWMTMEAMKALTRSTQDAFGSVGKGPQKGDRE